MTSKVKIVVTVPQSYEVPSGIYHYEEFLIGDAQWQNLMSALTEFEVELMSMAPRSSAPSANEVGPR